MQILPKQALLMAPMVDLSHVAYRQMVRSFSGCDIFYSEMLNSRIVPSENPRTSVYLKWDQARDLVFQIVGNDPARMQEAAQRLDGYDPRGIDINMGCYLKKIVGHGWGVSLMKEITLAEKIVTAVRKVVKRPLSVKIRIGMSPDRTYLKEFASMLENAGADFIVLHARTAADGLGRKAIWDYITSLKQHVNIPVVGNGDIRCPKDAIDMFDRTGCDGVMIGRQALITPWIFRDIKAALHHGTPPESPDLCTCMLELGMLLEKHFPADVALKRFKEGIGWLASNLAFGHYLAKQARRSDCMEEMNSKIRECFESGIG